MYKCTTIWIWQLGVIYEHFNIHIFKTLHKILFYLNIHIFFDAVIPLLDKQINMHKDSTENVMSTVCNHRKLEMAQMSSNVVIPRLRGLTCACLDDQTCATTVCRWLSVQKAYNVCVHSSYMHRNACNYYNEMGEGEFFLLFLFIYLFIHLFIWDKLSLGSPD
jgi:hypothetical protein